jgi:hypothetical protein
MVLITLLFNIDEAARNYWRTKDPKYKKEWYRLARVFAKQKTSKRKVKNK